MTTETRRRAMPRCHQLRDLLLASIFVVTMLGGCVTDRSATTRSTTPLVEQRVLLFAAADHEALYTLAGGLKPMSTGIWRGDFEIDAPDLAELDAVRQALAPLRNDVWYADVQVFDKVYDGTRAAHAFVVHRTALARMIERHDSFWGPRGVTPSTHPAEIVAVVDRMPREDRWRGYGYLFGYPDDAVDFFVDAGLAAEDGREIGPGKDREFVQIPTYAAPSGHFTYAIPMDHVETVADRALAEHATAILAAYVETRPDLIDGEDVVRAMHRLETRFEPLVSTDDRLRNRSESPPAR